MELSVFCIVIIVGVASVPGGAQGGIFFEPWQTKSVQEGSYVEVKQKGSYLMPKQEGEEMEPKQNVIHMESNEEGIDTRQSPCRYKLIVDESGQTITSPRYPRKYPNNLRCSWRIKAQRSNARLNVECNDFNVWPSAFCREDRFLIFENRVLKERFCGTGPVSFSSTARKIKIKFKTNRRRRSTGFSCQVRAVSPSPETCDCGVANPSRIVGGEEVTPPHKYPWQVGLKFNGDNSYLCGGSIICNKYVLTAAHCFYDEFGNPISTDGLVVGVGDHNMVSTGEDVPGVTREVIVKRVIIHPDYSFSTNDNDIALLKLSEKLDLSQHTQIGAVCLPADDSKTYEGMIGIASGWGALEEDGNQPDVLNEVSLPILAPSCFGMADITERMVCAGFMDGGKDTCQGDSGGPLTVQENSKYFQVGITSWGIGCAQPNHPGVYTRVSKFLPWIKDNTGNAACCF